MDEKSPEIFVQYGGMSQKSLTYTRNCFRLILLIIFLIMKVRLIISDIEGCISAGKGLPLDLGTLQIIQRHNQEANNGTGVPLTLCTGRSQPFVEAFCQMLDVYMPCVYENGSFIFDPMRDISIRNPAITELHIEAQKDLVRLLESKLAREYPHRREPGKEVCISLNPEAPQDRYTDAVVRLCDKIREAVDLSLFTVTHSASAVDITPYSIDKGSGVRLLSEITGIAIEEMVGIGDTIGDLPLLKITGMSAAPANCSSDIRDVVDYVSIKAASEGVVDIISWVSNPRITE
jgi:HAD superfamily hydrolase (TIGR01484 family)